MKLLIAVVAAVGVLAGAIGCEHSTVKGPEGQKLSLAKPADQTLKRGETNEVTVVINRDNFNEPIVIRFDDLPKGVEVVEKDKKVLPSDSTAKYTLHANDSADLVANHRVKVTAVGPNDITTSEYFMITVKERG